jgi:hypothetical protein
MFDRQRWIRKFLQLPVLIMSALWPWHRAQQTAHTWQGSDHHAKHNHRGAAHLLHLLRQLGHHCRQLLRGPPPQASQPGAILLLQLLLEVRQGLAQEPASGGMLGLRLSLACRQHTICSWPTQCYKVRWGMSC